MAGLRRRAHEDGRAETDVVYSTQFQSGRAMTNWRSIGTPYGSDWERADQIGFPVAAVDGVGLHLYFRNAGGGVSGRRQDARGIWGSWLDIEGNKVIDSGSVGISDDGLIELAAPAPDYVLRWRQEEPGGALKRQPDTAVKARPGSFASAPAPAGGVAHYWRTEGDSVLHVQDAGSGEPRALASLGGDGSGPVAALGDVLAQRSDAGRVVVAVGEDGPWADTGQECVGAPALARDAEGRLVLAAVGPDGGLRVARQRGAGAEFGAWVQA